ncbi:MAG: MnhB domain-containing protein [Candidatus Altiarchaeota archaeon]
MVDRSIVAFVFFSVLCFTLMYSLSMVTVDPGINLVYILEGTRISPNVVASVILDWRGFDTLGECLVLVTGVLAVSMLYGRGGLVDAVEKRGDTGEDVKPGVILDYATPFMIVLTTAYGIYVTLGGHITPGGGFQGGAIIAAGGLISLVVYGRGHMYRMTHEFLVLMESFGLLAYLTLGLVGLFAGGYYLYNVGSDIYGVAPSSVEYLLDYPDSLKSGILPYLNIAIMLKVSAGLMTILLVLLEVRD